MLGAFLRLDTKSTWVLLILAQKSGFKPHVSKFGFILSFAPPCTIPQVPPPPVLCYYLDVGATFCLHTQIMFNFADTFGMQQLYGPSIVVL